MITFRKIAVGFTALIVTAMVTPTPNAQAQMLEEKLKVTFSGPVELPGTVLPAGSYVFEALETGRLTRVLSADETHTYATLITVPDEKKDTATKPLVILEEGPKGGLERVEAWFYPGYSIGNEFIYPSTHSGKGPTSMLESPAKLCLGAATAMAKDVARSAEFFGVRSEHVVVNSGRAIERGARYLVS